MRKLPSFYTACLLLGIGLLVAAGLASCALPRTNGSGDVAEFVPPPAASPLAAVTVTAPPEAAAPAPEATPTTPAVAAVQTGAVIRLEPPTAQLNLGETVTLDIVLENISNLMAADVQLQFDPAILQAEDADPGQDGVQLQPGDFLSPDFPVANEIDNATGLAQYIVSQQAPTPPVNGTGVLARITFRAQANGLSQLTFPQVLLSTPDGQPIAVVEQPGQIGVGQAPASPTPTWTSTPIVIPLTPTFTPIPGTPTPTPTATPLPPPPVTPTPMPTITPVPPLTTIPPDAITGFCYRVQQGDTLYGLGQKFGVPFQRISALNKLYPPDALYANQGLFIPDSYGGGYHGPKVYIAQPGDTLDSVAETCNLPTAFLADVNDLDENAALQAGHVLFLPIPPSVPVPPAAIWPPHAPQPYPPYHCCPPPPCYGPKPYCY